MVLRYKFDELIKNKNTPVFPQINARSHYVPCTMVGLACVANVSEGFSAHPKHFCVATKQTGMFQTR